MRAGLRAADVLVLVVLAAWATPFFWQVRTSLTPDAELLATARALPERPTLIHYRAVVERSVMPRALGNSLAVASLTTLVALALGLPAAYGIARLPVPGKGLLLLAVVGSTAFPQIATVSPLYLLLRALRLIDTYPGLILPYLTFAMPLAVWLLVGFFRQLPLDLEEAALVDGASRWQSFTRVILPVSVPALATTAILTFIYCWNEFLFALSFTLGPDRQTVPVAIALFRGQYQVPWGQILAAAVVATVPVAALVLIAQRRIVQGLTAGAVKG